MYVVFMNKLSRKTDYSPLDTLGLQTSKTGSEADILVYDLGFFIKLYLNTLFTGRRLVVHRNGLQSPEHTRFALASPVCLPLT